MDLNLVVLAGRLAAPPEIRQFESGALLARFLLTVRSQEPKRRLDVIPTVVWDPPAALVEDPPRPGDRLWAAGSVQRRFWSAGTARRSRLEIVATQLVPRVDQEHEAT